MNAMEHALRVARLTDTGLLRTRNEDAIASDASIGFALLADGMGGYNAGDVASQMAALSITAECTNQFNQARQTKQAITLQQASIWLMDAVATANSAILEVSNTQAQCAGMGTTLVVALFIDNQVVIGHIGDSRAYMLRNDQLSQLTNDHSLLQEQIDAGLLTVEQAKHATYKNFVTKALGVDPVAELEVNTHAVQVGDLYLLCSDGLTDMVDDHEIESTLITYQHDLEALAHVLIRKANQRGGKDNISVILISVIEDFSLKQASWLQNMYKKVTHKG